MSLVLYACTDINPESSDSDRISKDNFEKNLQERLINAKEGESIVLPEGTFNIQRQISFNDAQNVTISGAGMKKTVLSFKNQIEGAEGLSIKGSKGITLKGFSILDTKGDAIKIQDSEDVKMQYIGVSWTSGPSPENGAYGLYPVSCKNVLLEDCEASYAMDAGIYVGQSENILVRRCYAHHNVAGIEIENSTNGAVYDNIAEKNTAGLLIFDMPDIPVANGARISVHNNIVRNNNFMNFSEKGNVVNMLPPGTGMLLMAHTQMDVFENTIEGHNTLGMGIVSWLFTGKPFKSKKYMPFCSAINVYNNTFKAGSAPSDTTTDFGRLLTGLFQGYRDVITDGIFNPGNLDDQGKINPEKRICIRNNGDISFVNLNAHQGGEPQQMAANMNIDADAFDCELESVDISGHDDWINPEIVE